ncbi:AAA family ATPase [Tenacibaculum sp. 190524A05c]|uniref:AAA family ATPase n=1 Tax=Tenacibaculum platacis TaxID=3137852 RepID=UPI0032B12EB1
MSWKLSAFYLDDHRQFGKNVVVNLGGEFFYKINNVSSNGISILRKENENYISDFFGKDVSLLSALVGSNGVGKTSMLLELITNKEVVLFFERDKEVTVIKNNYLGKPTLKLNKLDFNKNNVAFLEKNILDERNHYGYNIEANGFYSPKFSYYNPQASTNYFLSKVASDSVEYENLLELNAIRQQRALLMFSNSKLMDEISEVYNDFPRYKNAKIKIDKLSEEVLWQLEIELSAIKKGEKGKDIDFDIKLLELIDRKEYIEKINFLSRYDDTSFNFRLNAIIKIYVMSRVLMFIWMSKKRDKSFDEPYLEDEVKLLSEEKVVSWLKQIKKKYEKESNGEKLKYFIELGLEWYSLLPKKEEITLQGLNKLIENNFFFKQEELNNIFFNQDNYLIYSESAIRVDFQLGGVLPSYSLSQGEENLLNLLSSFYVNEHLKENRPQILLLDEATSGFHPKWQKKFVNTLVKILPLIFESKIPKIEGEILNKSQIQIVFTSHDPFPLSDVPSSNIVYLYNLNGQTKIASTTDFMTTKKSFGANITDLLEDSFFMGETDEALVGEFAQNKINGVIRWIENENERKFRLKEDYNFKQEEFDMNLKIIKLIDEHIVQLKLAEMMDELIDNNQAKKMILSSQISNLQLRLNGLN